MPYRGVSGLGGALTIGRGDTRVGTWVRRWWRRCGNANRDRKSGPKPFTIGDFADILAGETERASVLAEKMKALFGSLATAMVNSQIGTLVVS